MKLAVKGRRVLRLGRASWRKGQWALHLMAPPQFTSPHWLIGFSGLSVYADFTAIDAELTRLFGVGTMTPDGAALSGTHETALLIEQWKNGAISAVTSGDCAKAFFSGIVTWGDSSSFGKAIVAGCIWQED